jgi:hypothetical protein
MGKTAVNFPLPQKGKKQFIENEQLSGPRIPEFSPYGMNIDIFLEAQTSFVHGNDGNAFKMIGQFIKPPGRYALGGMVGVGSYIKNEKMHFLLVLVKIHCIGQPFHDSSNILRIA